MAAAVASVFELPIAAVPDLRGYEWWLTLSNWLFSHGWAPLYFEDLPPTFSGYCIGMGDGPPRGDGQSGRRHAIVWTTGPVGGIAHDPHPSRGGLITWPHGYVVFAPLDPGGMLGSGDA
jgi:hypothetical protein